MARMEDKQAIAELMNGWIYRDTAQWDKLQSLFSDDAIVEVTWFEGKAKDFIAGSRKMSESVVVSTKHFIGSPSITFHGDKALAETNATIFAQNASLKLGVANQNRFFDYIEKISGVWKIVRRQSIYDFGTFQFPAGIVQVDPAIVAKFPLAYAPLGYLLESAGYSLTRVFATKDSALEKKMRIDGEKWLLS